MLLILILFLALVNCVQNTKIDDIVVHNVSMATASYTYACVGNCNNDITTNTVGGILLMGGGPDVDEAFVWLIRNSGGGDILVLRASGTDAYNEYIYGLGRVNSVSTIICHSKDASTDAFVLEKVSTAEAVFFAGGDQYLYYTYWSNTPLADEINKLITLKRVTMGGTSAGMMIQSQFIFTAQYDSVISSEALSNPYNRLVTIGSSFISHVLLENVITDSHFYERDRMGRLMTFVARIDQDGLAAKPARAIACDEQTAILVSENGKATVASPAGEYAYFLYATKFPSVCKSGLPLSFEDVEVYKMGNGEVFDLMNWSSSEGKLYSLTADAGILSSSGNNGRIY